MRAHLTNDKSTSRRTRGESPRSFRCSAALALVALAGVLASSACTTGSGEGAASGELFMLSCTEGRDRGTPAAPRLFDLGPSFFAGEPIDDTADGLATNRLLLRLQKTGGRVETVDSLFFDIVDVYEVARCIRGASVELNDGTLVPDYDTSRCVRTADDRGRIRIGSRDYIHASLVPNAACDRPMVAAGVACETDPLGCPAGQPDNWDSYIEFEAFGEAVQPAGARTPLERDYKVDFGDRIRAARFVLTLVDQRVIEHAVAHFPAGDPVAYIGGRFEGWFEFDLERGRATQTFP